MLLSSNLHTKTLLEEEPLALNANKISWCVVMEGDHMNNNAQTTNSRKIMVVADPTRESTGALQYALSHAIHEHDELILLHVELPNTWKLFTFSTFLRIRTSYFPVLTAVGPNNVPSIEGSNNLEGENVDFLEEMKRICKVAQPKVRVRVERVTQLDGKDKAATILAQTTALGVDVLVTGQRKSFSATLLGYKPGGTAKGAKPIDTADYLIENSKCTCVAVQKKGQNGGYLLNTKTHKNFWLLA